MPSPDVTSYIDLRLYDKTAEDLVELALADAAVQLPGWDPTASDQGRVLIEVFSLLIEELVFTVNRIPGAVIEVLLGLFQLLRSPGTPPVTTVRFHVSDLLGHEVPIGTTVRLDLGDDVDPVDFTTDVGLVIAPGFSSGVVAATGSRPTIDANGVIVGTELELVDAGVGFVESVEIETAPVNGTEAEAGDEFLTRGVQRLARLVTTLVHEDHFVSAALENVLVYRARALDRYDSDAGSGVPGDHNGHVSVAVLGPGGGVLTAPQKAALEADLEELALGVLDVHVFDPTITLADVDVTVLRLAGFTNAQVEANVLAALNAYLDPLVWAWGASVYRNELIALIDGVAGVDRVQAVLIGGIAADFALAGQAPLADLAGGSSVTVNAP